MKEEHIFVPGGAGFIGSHVVKHHLKKGDLVWVVDNLHSGKLENVEEFRSHPKFKLDLADVRTWEGLNNAVKWADRIYNMAAYVGQRMVLAAPVDTILNNVEECQKILEAMLVTNSKARLLIPSTSEVYCHSFVDPYGTVPEDTVVTIPSGSFLQEAYPVSKLANEVMALSYVYQHGFSCTIARIFNTVGVNQSALYGMVVPNFINQALSNQPLTVFGDGLQTRSFSNATDTVRALDLLLSTPSSNGQIVNVGDDRECSIIDLAHLVIQLTQSKSKIRYLSYEEAYGVSHFVDVRRRQPDLSRLRALTGFAPHSSLADAIEEIIESKRTATAVRT